VIGLQVAVVNFLLNVSPSVQEQVFTGEVRKHALRPRMLTKNHNYRPHYHAAYVIFDITVYVLHRNKNLIMLS